MYYGLPSNLDRLGAFYKEVRRIWYRAPRCRSQWRLTWETLCSTARTLRPAHSPHHPSSHGGRLL